MISRRGFIEKIVKVSMGFYLGLGAWTRAAWAAAERKLLPKTTSALKLSDHDPSELDASQLEINPIEKFGTMGLSNLRVDVKTWRLEVGGMVEKPLKLTYDQVRKLPQVERKELLICPGVFSYQALYQGVWLEVLLNMTGLTEGAREVVISGPAGPRAKRERFTMAEIRSHRVFLAWAVNGRDLPVKHGFPLRVVAPDRYGDDWVKYVAKIQVV